MFFFIYTVIKVYKLYGYIYSDGRPKFPESSYYIASRSILYAEGTIKDERAGRLMGTGDGAKWMHLCSVKQVQKPRPKINPGNGPA